MGPPHRWYSECLCLQAGDFYPPPPTNAIVLNFDNRIPEASRAYFREDFWRRMTPATTELAAAKLKFHHRDGEPTNYFSLANFWQPYKAASVITNLKNKPINCCQWHFGSRFLLDRHQCRGKDGALQLITTEKPYIHPMALLSRAGRVAAAFATTSWEIQGEFTRRRVSRRGRRGRRRNEEGT